MISSEVLIRLQASVTKLHDELGGAQRYGHSFEDGEEARKVTAGCYGGATPKFSKRSNYDTFIHSKFFWACFHGDGMVYNLSDLTDPVQKQKTQTSYARPWNKFEGTPRSLEWIKFLMSENSPWKALHPFIVDNNLDFMNNAGFIFDSKDLPVKLWYNFLMAIRFLWEQPEAASTFFHLTEILPDHPPQLSLFIANHFMLRKGATEWQGPWEIVYPWSFLEGLGVEQVKRFVNCDPGDLSTTADNSPNVEPLWGNQGPSQLSLMFEDLSDKGTLTLDKITYELRKAI